MGLAASGGPAAHGVLRRSRSGWPASRRQFLASLAVPLFPAARRLLAFEDPTYSTDVNVVNVIATVRDKQGCIVTDLARDDFELREDDRVQQIQYFARQSDLPLSVGLLVDTSMSQANVLEPERRASYKFFDDILREKDVAFVIHFDKEVELLQDLTSSRKDLQAALDRLDVPDRPELKRKLMSFQQWPGQFPGQWPGQTRIPGGGRRRDPDGQDGPGRGQGRLGGHFGTALYDAVFLASDEVLKKQTGRKALVLISDGVDVGSKVGLEEAVEAAQRADILVYTIRFYDSDAYNRRAPRRRSGGTQRGEAVTADGKKTLERIAGATGGGFFDVSKKLAIDEIYTQIQEELRNEYSIGYRSDRPVEVPGEFRKIALTVKRKNVVVQARNGYYTRRS